MNPVFFTIGLFAVFFTLVVPKCEAKNLNGECPTYPSGVNCFVDPCQSNNCNLNNEICCADYSRGCDYHCIRKSPQGRTPPAEFKCPNYPENVSCFVNPCQTKVCPSNKTCCADYSRGCDAHCLP